MTTDLQPNRFVQPLEWITVVSSPRTAGGPGSGYHGHAGRPGQVGGSAVADRTIDLNIDLTTAAKHFAHTFEGGARVAKASAEYIQHGEPGLAAFAKRLDEDEEIGPYGTSMEGAIQQVATAKILVDEIRRAPLLLNDLWRGIAASNPTLRAELENATVGQTISLGRITAFTTSRTQATRYAEKAAIAASVEYDPDLPLFLLRVEGKSQSLETDRLTGMDHQEHLTTGLFEVVRFEDPRAHSGEVMTPEIAKAARLRPTIVIRQKGVF